MGVAIISRDINTSNKSVPDSIFDKFVEYVRNDGLFNGISDNLITLVRRKKPNKNEIEKLLRKTQDENTKPES